MVVKKKSAAPKRAPRQVWILVDGRGVSGVYAKRGLAQNAMLDDERVVGPYILAERVRER